MANDPHTFHVHFGIHHTVKKTCGLCDKEYKNAEDLKEHLSKCEIYVCDNSGCKEVFENSTTVEKHIKEITYVFCQLIGKHSFLSYSSLHVT